MTKSTFTTTILFADLSSAFNTIIIVLLQDKYPAECARLCLQVNPVFLLKLGKCIFEYPHQFPSSLRPSPLNFLMKDLQDPEASRKENIPVWQVALVHQDQTLTPQEQFLPDCSSPHQGPGPPLTPTLTPDLIHFCIFIINFSFLPPPRRLCFR